MGFLQLLGAGSPTVASNLSYDAVAFNGSSYMSRANSFSNGSQLTFTGFFNKTTAGTSEFIDGTDSGHVTLFIDNSGFLQLIVSDSSFASQLTVGSAIGGLDNAAWHSYAISVDTNFGIGAKLVRVLIDRVLDTPMITDASLAFNINLAAGTQYIGSQAGVTNWTGAFAEQTKAATYIDWSVGANVAKFFNASNKPVDLGATGSTAYGSAPNSYSHIAAAGTASDYAIDRGGGTTYTITGSLSLAASKP